MQLQKTDAAINEANNLIYESIDLWRSKKP